MIQRENLTRLCADVGTLRAAISPKPALHQIYDGEIESQSAMPCQKNQPNCTPWRHAVVRFARQAMQP